MDYTSPSLKPHLSIVDRISSVSWEPRTWVSEPPSAAPASAQPSEVIVHARMATLRTKEYPRRVVFSTKFTLPYLIITRRLRRC
ncbi:hypothetical protein AVEN_123530-1 [Araneus ventricosus]|uniref:Uncharacterized protein n=1 Tax=Araneus ventricosus TaxID=182803 RepID=A0A4Y2UH65_ARAVE|nr:hypothetical protein AVEN_123530-1 [Araneus ventricosus]